MNNLSSDSGGGKMTGKIILPQKFKEHLDTILMGKNACLANLWKDNCGSTKEWEDNIYPQIAQSTCLQYKAEYRSIDAGFYIGREEFQGKTLGAALLLAIEHENNSCISDDEMHKLCMLNVPLRVLITYPYDEEYNHQQCKEDGLLERYKHLAKNADLFGDFVDKRQLMVIFGYKENDTVRWKYYLFNGEQFAPL